MKSKVALTLALLLAPALHADESRIPLYAAGAITAPGYYVLTRDVSGSISVNTNDVVIDLNGHKLLPSASSNGVLVSPLRDRITVKNGFISGGLAGVYCNTTAYVNLRFEGLTILGSGIGIDVHGDSGTVEVVACNILRTAGGIQIDGTGTSALTFSGLIRDCVVDTESGTPLNLLETTGFLVTGNVFKSRGSTNTIVNFNSTGGLLDANTVRANAIGDGIRVGTPYATVSNNVVADAGDNGIEVNAGSVVLERNRVFSSGGDGIRVNGDHCLVDGNVSQYNSDCGLDMAGGVDNAYRNNMLRGNGGAATCTVADDTNAGGNIT